MDKEKRICSLCYWHICDIKTGQSHETWYEWVDPKEGYTHVKIEGSHLNSVFLCVFFLNTVKVTESGITDKAY